MKFLKTSSLAVIALMACVKASDPDAATWKNKDAVLTDVNGITTKTKTLKDDQTALAGINDKLTALAFDDSTAEDMTQQCKALKEQQEADAAAAESETTTEEEGGQTGEDTNPDETGGSTEGDEPTPPEESAKMALFLSDGLTTEECETFASNFEKFTKLTEDKSSMESEISGLEGEIQGFQDDLVTINKGFTPATIETVEDAITNQKQIFLMPEITLESDLTAFEAFSTKLGLEIPKWEELKTKDTEEKGKSAETADVYENRIKADDLVIKAITDFKTFLDTTIIQAWKDAGASFVIPEDEFEDAVWQYQHDFVKSMVAQAFTFISIDKDHASKIEKYNAYIDARKKLMKELGKTFAPKATEPETTPDTTPQNTKEDAFAQMDMWMVGLLGLGLIIIVGACIAILKCKKKNKDNNFTEMK